MKIIDMHCDTISTLMDNTDELRNSDRMINAYKLRDSDYLLQCFAMFVRLENEKDKDFSPYKYCNEMIDKYEKEINKNKDIIRKAYTYDDIMNNMNNGYVSSLLTIEEGGTIEGSIDKLVEFYNRGVRMMCLTWNYQNEIASPNIDYYKLDKQIRNNDNVIGYDLYI